MVRWYENGKECFALRKHQMRVDMRVYCGEASNFSNQNDLTSSIKSIVSAAIMKGLDVIGVISNCGPQLGIMAQQFVQQSGLDIYVIPGEEYLTSDKTRLIVYLLKEPMPPNLAAEQAIKYVHQKGGFVMIGSLTKRQSQWLAKIKNTSSAPDAVELYSSDGSGYQDMHLDESYQCFITSGARNATDLERSNSFTIINRKDFEGLGILPEGEGSEYVPQYLGRIDQEEQAQAPGQNNQPFV